MHPSSSQPLVFADWMRSRLTLPGRACRAVLLERDGSISLHFASGAGPALLRWSPSGPSEMTAGQAPGQNNDLRDLGGRMVHRNLSRDDVESLASQMEAIAEEAKEPVWFAWGPSAETELVFAKKEGLGPLLRRWIEPKLTRWGDFVALEFEQPNPYEIELAFQRDGSSKKVSFAIQAPEERNAFGVRDLRLLLRHDERESSQDRPMDEQVERLVGFALGRALAAAPPLVLPTPPAAEEARPNSPPPNEAPPKTLADTLLDSPFPYALGEDFFFRTWGSNFLSNELVLMTPGFGSMISHGSRECLCPLVTVGGFQDHFNYLPWERRREDPERTLVTDFDDLAAVQGGMARLGDALGQAVNETERGRVYVLEMCDYECLSEDVTESLYDIPETSRERVSGFPNVSGPDGPLAVFDNRWNEILYRYGVGQDEQTPRSGVNLVGFGTPQSPALRELESLLAAVDVEVGARIFPYLDPRHMDRLPQPKLWVLNPWRVVQDGPGRYLTASDEPRLVTPAPYGLAGTRAWLDTIRGQLGVEALSDEQFDALVHKEAPALAPLVDEARGLGITFAVPEPFLDDFASPESFFGFDPIAFMNDLGLRTTVLVTRASSRHDALRARVEHGDVRALRPGESLAEAMQALDASLFYSEYTADERVLTAGKTPVNARHFEPGIAGTERTIRRLLRLGRAPFFRRYGAFLDEAQR